MEVLSHPLEQTRRRLLSLIVLAAAAVVLAALLLTHGIGGEAGSGAGITAVPQEQTSPFRWA